MSTKVFVNLPVKDLQKSMSFFKALGYSFNQQFTDDTAACLVISEDIYAMLITHPKMTDFIPKEKQIADATKTTEVLVCLSCDNRAAVDQISDKALASGGSKCRDPMDFGFMYGRSFQDPDGHIWEYIWMDPATIQKG